MFKKTAQILLALALLIPYSTVNASEKYSFENAERLKGRIEWRDYGNAAFGEAVTENKPIFLLLTAPSWCYWCQVYESEDYLFNQTIVDTINSDYIPVYVDADQRQDLTRQYLEGGWPSTTVMAPNKERLYGFSGVRPIENMKLNLDEAYTFVQENGFSNSNHSVFTPDALYEPTLSNLQQIYDRTPNTIHGSHDPTYGGFGYGQKFPQPRSLLYLLERYQVEASERDLRVVNTTLENQYTSPDALGTEQYNLYDPIDGGFHRYGVAQDWSPPHYEKMLYDNVKLLETYQTLLKIEPDNETAQIVVDGTRRFLESEWWDDENGAFYSNSDVHGEDAYYGQNPRPVEKPRVEKTKYADWNSDAIISFSNIYRITDAPEDLSYATRTADFIIEELYTEDSGIYHYITPDGERGVRGDIYDNAQFLAALMEVYEVSGDERYLEIGTSLADYMIENLYDWYGGGFFSRNSPDKEIYAGDHIAFDKPTEANAYATYGFLKLHTHTENNTYLGVAVSTLGRFQYTTPSLDRGYFFWKSAEIVLENSLLDRYAGFEEEFTLLSTKLESESWVNAHIQPTGERVETPKFQPSSGGIPLLDANLFILIAISFIAGLLSFLSPCTLPILPAYFAYNIQRKGKSSFAMSLAFFVGLILTFVAIGISVSLVGSEIRSVSRNFTTLAGIAIMIFGLMTIMNYTLPTINVKKPETDSYIGSFLFGSVMGISWTPCVGPILAAVLVLASSSSSATDASLLLAMYGIGLSVPLILLSRYIESIDRKTSKVWRFLRGRNIRLGTAEYGISVHSTTLISGALFIVVGLLIATGTMTSINEYIATTDLQKALYRFEQKIFNSI